MHPSTAEPPLDALMTFLSVARLGRYTAAAEVLAMIRDVLGANRGPGGD